MTFFQMVCEFNIWSGLAGQGQEAVVHLYGDRILPVDPAISRIAGKLSDTARGQGHAPGFADILIAATAHHHELVILTRNVRHFEPLGVPVPDPFEALPRSP
jgi:predicted nucleic acid-binding protein